MTHVSWMCVLVQTGLLVFTWASHEAAGDWGEVVLVQVLHRHGDRSPHQTYPNDPYSGNWSIYWPEGFSQMTKVGFEHGYELGQFLRARYGNLLPAKYNGSDVRVLSTYSAPTLQTAECLLAGLYPPLQNASGNVRWQPVPIFTTPTDQDYILEVPSCKLLDELDRAVQKTDEMKCVEQRISNIVKYLEKFAGTSNWNQVYDTFLSEVSLDLMLPEWSSEVYPDTLSAIWSWTQWQPTKLQQKFNSGNLISEMTTRMEETIKGIANQDKKLYLYTAHHTTIASFLSALQAFNFIAVPFTSAVMVELRQRSADDYAVAVWYRNTTTHEPYLLTMDGCESLCPFKTFLNITSSLVPIDYDKECSNSLPTDYKVELLKPGKNQLWDGCLQKYQKK